MAIDEENIEQLQNTIQHPRSFCKKVNIKRLVECLSSLLLPLALGVFTAVITLEQQKLAQQQRDEDREAAYQQRLEDQKAAEKFRELEQNISDTRYLDDVLNNYIKDMAEMMKENNGSFTSIGFVSILARAKTLNVFRQLDAKRNARVIRFLHEAEQLPMGNSLSSIDLSTAKLLDIDFRDLAINEQILRNISLTGIILHNSIFYGMQLEYINFSLAHFNCVDAQSTDIRRTQFESGKLIDINFSSSSLQAVNYRNIQMSRVNFSNSTLKQMDFSFSQLHEVNFSSVTLSNTYFDSAKLTNVDFSFATLNNVDFSSAELRNVNFTHAQLQYVKFTGSKLYNVNFSSNNFNQYYMYNIDFYQSTLNNIDFTFVKLHNINLSHSKLFLINFSWSTLVSADFSYAKLFEANFERTRCLKANFDFSDLVNANFAYANAKGASFFFADTSDANFHHANLQKTSFNQSMITDYQLASALSIHGAWLPNETRYSDPNLILNGEAYCNITLSSSWQVELGQVMIAHADTNTSDCRYLLQSFEEGAIMFQSIALAWKMNSTSTPESYIVLTARVSTMVSIQLIGISSTTKTFSGKSLTHESKIARLKLEPDMRSIDVWVHFHGRLNISDQSYDEEGWCDDLFVYIDYGPDILIPFRLEPNICNSEWDAHGTTIVKKIQRSTGLFIDAQQTVYIVETGKSRILAWRTNTDAVEVLVGQKGEGNRLDQLSGPTDVVVDGEMDTLFICDKHNQRVVRWPRRQFLTGDNMHETVVIASINCSALTMDNQGALYVSDIQNAEVRRFDNRGQNRQGTVVAGGHGTGPGLRQLSSPSYLFVDTQFSLYISDTNNHRVMKWVKGATTGIVVAGGNGPGEGLAQLWYPRGLWVDNCGDVYVVDRSNRRVMRWKKDATEGMVIAGGNGPGRGANQLDSPEGLFFDQQGHLVIVDSNNNRIQRFSVLV